jgi:hypothetical protein
VLERVLEVLDALWLKTQKVCGKMNSNQKGKYGGFPEATFGKGNFGCGSERGIKKCVAQ